MCEEKHIPVLLNEAIENLNIKNDGIYVDLTIGRAGHSSEILKRLSEKGQLIGFDQDEEAIKESTSRLNKLNKRFQIVRDNFSNLEIDLKNLNINHVDGFLMDLGVSSPQFDDVSRGFSYKEHALLDMRMDQRKSLNARKIINEYEFKDLVRIFNMYGEDKYSYQIAKKIVLVRQNHLIEYTDELVDIIKSVKPMKELAKKGHPAKQIFQALRIEVNDEYKVLEVALHSAIKMLNKGGRLVVITFHSGEDRIVKEIFKSYCVIEGNRKNEYIRPEDIEKPEYKLVINKPILPSEKELEINHRSHSAKMRVIEKI